MVRRFVVERLDARYGLIGGVLRRRRASSAFRTALAIGRRDGWKPPAWVAADDPYLYDERGDPLAWFSFLTSCDGSTVSQLHMSDVESEGMSSRINLVYRLARYCGLYHAMEDHELYISLSNYTPPIRDGNEAEYDLYTSLVYIQTLHILRTCISASISSALYFEFEFVPRYDYRDDDDYDYVSSDDDDSLPSLEHDDDSDSLPSLESASDGDGSNTSITRPSELASSGEGGNGANRMAAFWAEFEEVSAASGVPSHLLASTSGVQRGAPAYVYRHDDPHTLPR